MVVTSSDLLVCKNIDIIIDVIISMKYKIIIIYYNIKNNH